ncbi:phage capsid protein, partial [Bradyrhizobium canariense]
PYIDKPYEIDAGRNADNMITLLSAAQWANKDFATYDIVGDIETWAEISEGLTNVIITDPKTWALMRKFEKFNDALETRRGSNYQLATALKDLGATVSVKGNLGDVTIIVVDEEYIDRDGTTKKVQRDFTLILAHTELRGARLYGQIQDLSAQREGFDEAERYVKDWTENGDPEVRYTKTEAAP